MCNVAGYTGIKRAAPVLIDMIRREQFFDGGRSTGIVTVHEGKLYCAKVVGDVDVLLKETDAWNFPGTCGIIHSRPSGNLPSCAHPFLDETGRFAIVQNNTLRGVGTPEFYAQFNATAQKYYDRGALTSAHQPEKAGLLRVLSDGNTYSDSEVYALMIGEELAKLGATPENAAQAMASGFSALPCDGVILSVHADLPGLITAGVTTRPLSALTFGQETFLATTPFAFPEYTSNSRSIIEVPVASVSQALPGAFTVTGLAIPDTRIEAPSTRALALAYERIVSILKGQKDDPKCLYDFPIYAEWRDLWDTPPVECKFEKDGDLLKPTARLAYSALWSLHLEGRLRRRLGEYKNRTIERFWID